jgi:methylmalonyl-CoA mutase
MLYEKLKHDGTLPLIGVNTFLSADHAGAKSEAVPLIRSTNDEKDLQVAAVRAFQQRNAQRSAPVLQRLQTVATSGGNVFEELLQTVKVCSLGQISRALYDVGGQYRRNM